MFRCDGKRLNVLGALQIDRAVEDASLDAIGGRFVLRTKVRPRRPCRLGLTIRVILSSMNGQMPVQRDRGEKRG